MDSTNTVQEIEPVVDLESGGSECEEEPKKEPVPANRKAKNLIRSLGGTLKFEGSDEGESSSNSYMNSTKSSDDEYTDIESLIFSKFGGDNGDHMPLIDKRQMKEKHKNSNSKKAAKPPRPRKGPSLDTADLLLVKEISELAMKKRARVERLKALKKMKAAKASSPSSSHSSLFAMVITVLFFLVIIFQGFGSGQSSSLTFHDSIEPSAGATNSLISIQFNKNLLDSNGIPQISKAQSPNFVEQTSGSESRSFFK